MGKADFYSDEIIPTKERTSRGMYAHKIRLLEAKIKGLEEDLRQEKMYKNRKREELKLGDYRKKMYRIHVKNEDLYKKGKDFYLSRLRRANAKYSDFIDAVTGYPIMREFAKSKKIDDRALCFAIIAYHYQWVTRNELVFHGYSYHLATSTLRSMVLNGYFISQTFMTKEKKHLPTPKCTALVEEFHEHYKVMTKKMFDELHKKHQYWNSVRAVKINRKLKVGPKELRDADKQKNKEREQGS